MICGHHLFLNSLYRGQCMERRGMTTDYATRRVLFWCLFPKYLPNNTVPSFSSSYPSPVGYTFCCDGLNNKSVLTHFVGLSSKTECQWGKDGTEFHRGIRVYLLPLLIWQYNFIQCYYLNAKIWFRRPRFRGPSQQERRSYQVWRFPW